MAMTLWELGRRIDVSNLLGSICSHSGNMLFRWTGCGAGGGIVPSVLLFGLASVFLSEDCRIPYKPNWLL